MWYFEVVSDEYGLEEYGAYESEQEAQEALDRIRARARKLADGVGRFYSEPYYQNEEESED